MTSSRYIALIVFEEAWKNPHFQVLHNSHFKFEKASAWTEATFLHTLAPMRFLIASLLLTVVHCHAASGASAVYEGPGPDEACGGTSLTITEKNGRITVIEYAIFQSSQTVVQDFKHSGDDTWNVTIRVYSTDEFKTAKTLLYRFRETDHTKGEMVAQKLKLENIDWQTEPERILAYFHKEKKQFEVKSRH